MADYALTQAEAIERLKRSDAVTVTADEIAPCLKMNPGVLRKRVRDGSYSLSQVDYDPNQSGTIRFFRKDFLQKIGEMPPDPEELTDHQLLEKIWESLMDIRILLKAIANEKTAGAGTPTD